MRWHEKETTTKFSESCFKFDMCLCDAIIKQVTITNSIVRQNLLYISEEE